MRGTSIDTIRLCLACAVSVQRRILSHPEKLRLIDCLRCRF